MFFSHSNDAIQIQAEECSSADYLLAKKFSHSLEVQHIHKGVHAWQVSLESWCAWRARGGSVEVWSLMFKTDCVMSHVLVGVKMGSSSCDWAELWTARGCTWFWPLCKKEVPSDFFEADIWEHLQNHSLMPDWSVCENTDWNGQDC